MARAQCWGRTICPGSRGWSTVSEEEKGKDKDLFRLYPKNDGIPRSGFKLGWRGGGEGGGGGAGQGGHRTGDRIRFEF